MPYFFINSKTSPKVMFTVAAAFLGCQYVVSLASFCLGFIAILFLQGGATNLMFNHNPFPGLATR
jgi:hypothetical protein